VHIRFDTQKLKDGVERRYVSLVHNVWEPATPKRAARAKPVVFANFGREDKLDLGLVRSARDALDRYLQKRLAECCGARCLMGKGSGWLMGIAGVGAWWARC
jgi:hypothetical protein